jgi:hypothetical protein
MENTHIINYYEICLDTTESCDFFLRIITHRVKYFTSHLCFSTSYLLGYFHYIFQYVALILNVSDQIAQLPNCITIYLLLILAINIRIDYQNNLDDVA